MELGGMAEVSSKCFVPVLLSNNSTVGTVIRRVLQLQLASSACCGTRSQVCSKNIVLRYNSTSSLTGTSGTPSRSFVGGNDLLVPPACNRIRIGR
eukprot:scaffold2366_cov159-Amphora_coffeaeformis.AAC.12